MGFHLLSSINCAIFVYGRYARRDICLNVKFLPWTKITALSLFIQVSKNYV